MIINKIRIGSKPKKVLILPKIKNSSQNSYKNKAEFYDESKIVEIDSHLRRQDRLLSTNPRSLTGG